ncbi:hypothetical protein [uncultured Pseudonocardia sp.]|uniref:hypothetical protein n=1 Tax=uncultured Pseudonocardia sp. TaxID=211455 RepID=UPI0026035619|nr:hypothetical protein [uncultured Pseudonocardia sp.]
MISLRRLSLAAAAAVAAVLVGSGTAGAAPAVTAAPAAVSAVDASRPASPVGVWKDVVSRPDSPPENVDIVFGPNLRLVVRTSDGETPTGSWAPTGPTTFTFTFTRDLKSGDTTIGKITITHSATLGTGGRTFTSTGTATARDLQGNLLVTLPITSTATRVV